MLLKCDDSISRFNFDDFEYILENLIFRHFPTIFDVTFALKRPLSVLRDFEVSAFPVSCYRQVLGEKYLFS